MIVSPCFNLNVVVPLIATFSFFPLLSEPPVIVAGREYSSPSFPVNVTAVLQLALVSPSYVLSFAVTVAVNVFGFITIVLLPHSLSYRLW